MFLFTKTSLHIKVSIAYLWIPTTNLIMNFRTPNKPNFSSHSHNTVGLEEIRIEIEVLPSYQLLRTDASFQN